MWGDDRERPRGVCHPGPLGHARAHAAAGGAAGRLRVLPAVRRERRDRGAGHGRLPRLVARAPGAPCVGGTCGAPLGRGGPADRRPAHVLHAAVCVVRRHGGRRTTRRGFARHGRCGLRQGLRVGPARCVLRARGPREVERHPIRWARARRCHRGGGRERRSGQSGARRRVSDRRMRAGRRRPPPGGQRRLCQRRVHGLSRRATAIPRRPGSGGLRRALRALRPHGRVAHTDDRPGGGSGYDVPRAPGLPCRAAGAGRAVPARDPRDEPGQ